MATSTQEDAATLDAPRWRPWLAVALITVLGAAWRLALFSGDGLGDDHNFFVSYFTVFNNRHWYQTAYNYRFMQWLPIYAAFDLFGVSEYTWVLPNTLASVLHIPLAYALGAVMASPQVGVVAALLYAASPFDTLASTLILFDVVLSLYLGLAVLCFVRGDQGSRWWYVLAGLCMGLSYYAKMWGPFLLPFFGLLTLCNLRRLPRHLVFYATVAVVAALTIVADWHYSGDPFGYYHVTILEAGVEPVTRRMLLEYPRQMFLANEWGHYFHGWYFWALPLAAGLAWWDRRPVGMALLWLVVIFLTLEFMPQKITLEGWYSQGRFFRYLAILVLPTCLVLAMGADVLLRRSRPLGAGLLAAFVGASLVHGWRLTEPTRDCFGDMRQAAHAVVAMSPDTIHSDFWMISRIDRLEFRMRQPMPLDIFQSPNPVERRAEFARITKGYVITGGGRLPHYGNPDIVPNLTTSGFVPPPSWKLAWSLERPVEPWRREPIRIWRVD
jgi:4-amino-4-deoxy-L-arabinose transferase-like glycosyltransferase